MKKRFLGLVGLCFSFFASTSATANISSKTSTPNDISIKLTSVGGYYTKNSKKIQFVAFGAEMVVGTTEDLMNVGLEIFENDSCSGTAIYGHNVGSTSEPKIFKEVCQVGRFYMIFDETNESFVKGKTYYGRAQCGTVIAWFFSNIPSATGNYDIEYEI